MIVVDSTVWIDFYNDVENSAVDKLIRCIREKPDEIIVGDLMLAEVLQGFRKDSDYKGALLELSSYSQHTISSGSIATKSASNYRALRKKGVTVRKTIDCLIATFCIENDFLLLHNDRDFDPFEQHLKLKVL